MRFHGVHQFNAYPYIVRAGGMVQAFGPKMGHKAVHPDTGDITLCCKGFNDKNDYDRQTPCDQDYLRKMARKTDADLLQEWFNREVTGIFKQHHAFDPEGIFIGDATYLFVPDNDAYEGSARLLFDEHNHPVDSKKLTKKQQAAYTWRRCYKLVSLIHTNRAGEFFIYAGLRVVAGNANECPLLYEMVDDFVRFHGRGIIKRLILDRGFIDGPSIGRCKQEHHIDVLIPAKTNMDIYLDAVGLAEGGALQFQPWSSPTP
ncbi:MAG: transposase, partial [Burkholderiales bacterium]